MTKDENIFVAAKGESLLDSIPERIRPMVVAAEVDGKLLDLSTVATDKEIRFRPVFIDSPRGLEVLRHSAAHLLAQAVTELYLDAKPNAGPPTDDGFYYDIQMDPISSEELSAIEKRMHELVKKNIPIERMVMSRLELEDLFSHNIFKLDKIRSKIPNDGSSTVYRQGEFIDFCTGPHVPSTGYIRAFKLLSTASTHYMGDENREKMVRIYGTAFPDEKSLSNYLNMREEALKRDHRKIGQEMDLFVFNSERGPGFPFYTPNGQIIRNELISFMRRINEKYGWVEVWTPHLYKDTIWKQSGHYAKYKANMYTFTLPDGDSYGVKPMNCPGHITIFERNLYSYRDLPVRYFEAGTVYRYEKSGEVGGLTRPRAFTIDDGHAFMRIDQIVEEIEKVLAMVKEVFQTVFSNPVITYDLSVIDKDNYQNYLISYVCRNCGTITDLRKAASDQDLVCPNCGSKSLDPDFSRWDQATDALRDALKKNEITYQEFPGEAAFYGPKIDIHVKDAIGRNWQLSTIQLDFFMPANFGLTFINSAGKKETPVMLHRAVYGSYERFMVILLESYAGKLPTWLAPLQCYIIPVTDEFSDYAYAVRDKLQAIGVRSQVDNSSETLSKKVRSIRPKRPAYVVVVGKNEVEKHTVSARNRADRQKEFDLDEFLGLVKAEISERRISQIF
ncbi:MAG: threonine--tRNA ligase [Thermoplasmataceae archaeon]|jgi:threonyl-tRNA synthetase